MSDRLRHGQEGRGVVWSRAVITFSRARRGLGAALTATALALALAGCVAAKQPLLRAPLAVMAPTGPAFATVSAVRAINETGTEAGSASDPRASILAAMGRSPIAAATGNVAAVEIVVKTDDGQTLSVVQPDAGGLAPGQRVVVLPEGGRQMVAPAPPAS
jgi:hypothetical protein